MLAQLKRIQTTLVGGVSQWVECWSLIGELFLASNNPYLNLVDYAVWGALQQRVYCDDCLKLWNS